MAADPIRNFREEYPEYNDLPDEKLLPALHKSLYPDLSYDQFDKAFRFRYGARGGVYEADQPVTPEAPTKGMVSGRGGKLRPAEEAIAEEAPKRTFPEVELKEKDSPEIIAITQAAPLRTKIEGGYLGQINEALKRGTISFDLDHKAYDAAIGLKDFDKDVKKGYEQFQRRIRTAPLENDDLWDRAILGAAQMLPGMVKGYGEGLSTGLGMAAVTALATAKTGPGVAITAPSAFAAGTLAGSTQAWYRQGTGQMYADMRMNGIDHNTASVISQIAGMPYAMIETTQVGRIVPGLRPAFFQAVKGSAAEVVQRMVAKYGKDWAKETGEEVLQEVVAVVADTIGRKWSNLTKGTAFESPEVGEIMNRLLQTGIDAALSLGVLILPGKAYQAGKSGVESYQQAREDKAADEAAAQQQALLSTIPGERRPVLGETVEEVKARQRHEKISEREPGEFAGKQLAKIFEKIRYDQQGREIPLERIEDAETLRRIQGQVNIEGDVIEGGEEAGGYMVEPPTPGEPGEQIPQEQPEKPIEESAEAIPQDERVAIFKPQPTTTAEIGVESLLKRLDFEPTTRGRTRARSLAKYIHANDSSPLGDLAEYIHDALPENAQVYLVDDIVKNGVRAAGLFDRETGTILINEKIIDQEKPRRAWSQTVLHEMTHLLTSNVLVRGDQNRESLNEREAIFYDNINAVYEAAKRELTGKIKPQYLKNSREFVAHTLTSADFQGQLDEVAFESGKEETVLDRFYQAILDFLGIKGGQETALRKALTETLSYIEDLKGELAADPEVKEAKPEPTEEKPVTPKEPAVEEVSGPVIDKNERLIDELRKEVFGNLKQGRQAVERFVEENPASVQAVLKKLREKAYQTGHTDYSQLVDLITQVIGEKPQEPRKVPEVPTPPQEKPTKRPTGTMTETELEKELEQKEKPSPLPQQQVNLIASIEDAIRRQGIKDNPALYKLADAAYGKTRAQGGYTSQDAYNALEAAVHNVLKADREYITAPLVDDEWEATEERINTTITHKIPTQAARTLEKDILQQFSTPPTLALIVDRLADIKSKDIVLEPSAGTGMLLAYIDPNVKVYANEIDGNRADILKHLGYSVTEVDAEILNDVLPDNIKPTVIVMNPPFSATGGRVKQNKTEFGLRHIRQALQRLEPNGRLVAVLGESAYIDRSSILPFWKEVAGKYNIKGMVQTPGELYRKFGTTFGNTIVVIDNDGPTPGANFQEQMNNFNPQSVTSLEEAWNYATNILQTPKPETAKAETPGREPKGVTTPPAVERPSTTVRGEPGTVAEPVERGSGVQPTEPGRGVDTPGTRKPGSRGEAVEEGKPGPTVKETEQAPPEGRGARGAEAVREPDVTKEDIFAQQEKLRKREEEQGGKFTEYIPQRLKIKGAKKHPAKVVESGSMAAVESPDIDYIPNLPREVITEGKLSELQLESISYAGHQHSIILPNGKRAGFFVGDGTGIGKGRTIGGIILDNYNQGRKRAIWLSSSSGLYKKAKGDLESIRYPGSTALINSYGAADKIDLSEGIIFSTYSSLISKSKTSPQTRLQQIMDWLGDDGVIIFDEAHKAKNALATSMGEPSQTGLAVIKIQDDLPNARIVYSSATGATDVRNMAYMTRMGLWGEGTPFTDFNDFMNQIERGGIGAMEMVARDMKALGKYASRFISFDGVIYNKLEHALTPEQRNMYDIAARAWQTILQNINVALDITNSSKRAKVWAMQRFWNDHQRFFRNIITAFKVPTIIKKVEESLADDKSVVISLQTTGEARTKALINQAVGEGTSLEELDFTPREVIGAMLESAFPTQLYQEEMDEQGNVVKVPVIDANGNPVHSKEALALKEKLLDELSDIQLPDNPIDQIINYFGSDKVAELTGRKKRIIRDPVTGQVTYEKRNPEGVAAKDVNVWEADNFQDGKKRIAIFSDAAAEGIDLHSDLNRKNSQQRVHIILELGWSSDKEMQRLGRSHRSNQKFPPEIEVSMTNIGGETRFFSTIAKRLESMEALGKGQRDTSVEPLSEYNFETKEGQAALTIIYQNILKGETVPFLENAPQALRDMGILVDKGQGEGIDQDTMNDVTRFLNRVLALDIERQNALFDYYIQTLNDVIEHAKATGQFDSGVSEIEGTNIKFAEPPQLVYTDELTGAKTYHYLIEADVPVKTLSFEDAEKSRKANPKSNKYFRQVNSGHMVFAQTGGSKTDPTTGRTIETVITMNYLGNRHVVDKMEFKEKYVEVSPQEVEQWWNEKVAETPDTKKEKTHIIGGVILPLWNKLQTGIGFGRKDKLGDKPVSLKVVRATTEEGDRVVGVRVPEAAVGNVLRALNIKQSLLSAEDIYNAVVEQDQAIELIGNKRLIRTSLNREPVIEVLNVNTNEFDRFRGYGLISERINYKQRFFVPADPQAAMPILEKMLKDYPVFEEKNKSQASYSRPTVSQEEAQQTTQVNRPPAMTKQRKERQRKKKEEKLRQEMMESGGKEKKTWFNRIREMVFSRRAEIDLGMFDTNILIDNLNKNFTPLQREVFPFLIEKTEVPPSLNRPDLEAEYERMKDNPIVEEWLGIIKDHFDKAWEYMRTNIDDFSAEQIEDYVTHIWDLRKGKKDKVRQTANWFVTRNRFLKKRHVESIYLGIEELGLTPRTLDIGEIVRIHDAVMYRSIANNRFVKKVMDLRKDGLPLVARVDVAPADWIYMDHPALRKQIVIPGTPQRGEIISDELAWILNELGVEIGRRIAGKAWGRPVRKQGEYTPGEPAQIRLQRFFESSTIAHEIGHHIDSVLRLGEPFLNQYKSELYAINRQRIADMSEIGKRSYAESPEEQIAEFFAYLFVNPRLAEQLAPNATADMLGRLAQNETLTKLVNLDWENKAKILIQEQMNTRLKLPVKVHPDIAKPLKVVLDQRIDDAAGIIRAIEMIQGVLKKTWLSISFFHHLALTETGAALQGPLKTLKIVNPLSFIYRGMIRGDNLAFANTDIAKDFIANGGQLGASSDIPVQKIQEALNTVARKTKNIPLARNIAKFIASFNQRWDKALWDYLHDGLKIQAYEHLTSSGKYIGRSKREAAQFVNDTFGGQNWDNLMINPKTVQILSWTLLSPDWTISTLRQALAVTGFGKVYKETVSVRRKAGGMFWLKALFYFGVGINMLNMLFRKWDEEEYPEYNKGKKRTFWDYTMWGNTIGHQTNLFAGRYEDGTERYIRWGKQFRELFEFFIDEGEFSPVTAALKRFGSKAAPLWQIIPESFTGTSLSGFQNRDIYGKTGNERAWGIAKRILLSPIPFSLRTTFQDKKEWMFTDLAMPSSKGMTNYRAVQLFKTAIEQKNERIWKETYQGAIANGLDAFGLFQTAMQMVKAENTKDIRSVINNIEEAEKQLKESDSFSEKRAIRGYIGKQEAIKRKLEVGNKLLGIGLKQFRLQEINERMDTLKGRKNLNPVERRLLRSLETEREKVMKEK